MNSKVALALFGLGIPLIAAGAISAADPEKGGRYTMQPADGGGFVRLDTLTGTMALCQRQGDTMQCKDLAYEPGQQQARINELETENQKLRDDVKRLEESLGIGPPGSDGDKAEGKNAQKFELPSEQDVDKAIDYFGRIIKKFREKIKEFEEEDRKGGTTL
jgi:hypothetical protein